MPPVPGAFPTFFLCLASFLVGFGANAAIPACAEPSHHCTIPLHIVSIVGKGRGTFKALPITKTIVREGGTSKPCLHWRGPCSGAHRVQSPDPISSFIIIGSSSKPYHASFNVEVLPNRGDLKIISD